MNHITMPQFTIGFDQPLTIIAGPCVIESEQLVMDVAGQLQQICQSLALPLIFKSSFDKANRTSHHSFRGLGIEKGLAILQKVKQHYAIAVITDVHEDTPLNEVADVVDVLQTPAFLCRQTNFIQRVAQCGLPVNIKKGQFLSPWEMSAVAQKAKVVGNDQIMLCERGFSFGYNNLVVDMRSLTIMRQTGCPIIFDATHSVQQPGAKGFATGGQREFIPTLARAAVAVGVAGVFMETHPNPDQALSDGPNSWPLHQMMDILTTLKAIDETIKSTHDIVKE